MATETDNVNSGALVTLLFVGAFATLGIALVVTALVRTETTEEVEKKEVGADRPYRDLVDEQTAKLAAPAAYLDRGKGQVSLPIERAMELMVSGLQKDPNSATPPAPIGGAGGTAAAAGTGGAAAEMAGTGGTGGTATEGEAKPADEAVHAEGGKPAVPAEEKKDEKKKDAPKPHAPAAPVPAAPAPHPAPAPAAPAPAAPAP